MYRVALIGTEGLPAQYGGFETVVSEFLHNSEQWNSQVNFEVYCAAGCSPVMDKYCGAKLVHIPMSAHGWRSMVYDGVSIIHALWHRADVLMCFGVSGSWILLLVRLFTRTRIIAHVDGIEWQRAKWSPAGRFALKVLEYLAVRFAHRVISDNAGITRYLKNRYGSDPFEVAYGGDHALRARASISPNMPDGKFILAICRIEPENNVDMILEAMRAINGLPLVMIGNWGRSPYGRALKEVYKNIDGILLLDPIYDIGVLKGFREKTSVYVHGHSAGGTNPSLVEAMFFGVPIIAFDCDFNRFTTANKALYFKNKEELAALLNSDVKTLSSVGKDMASLAIEKYRWADVIIKYQSLILEEISYLSK